MFVNVSKAGLGMYVALLATLVKLIFGVNLDENILAGGIVVLIQAIGFILWIVGQITRKDLSFGIFRVNEEKEN
jgi:small neutral amino acid transporter SnatA (MarC family)